MKYGYFDDENREYVITRPDTPVPWANYLGSPEYGAIISNNAGGYSFVKSGANGRILRYRFNSVPADQAGRYIYLRDREDGDYWSASWQPVGKPLESYESECRHGLSYTVISSLYSGIRTRVLYYVPLGGTYEVWRLEVKNESERERKLSVFGFAEFTNDDNYEQDAVNLQYTQFITRTCFAGNRIVQKRNEYCGGKADGTNGLERFFGLAGAKVSSYCGDREEFLGGYRDYSDPIAVERGSCGDRLNYNGNSCGALQTELALAPGEARELCFLAGAHGDAEAAAILSRYEDPGRSEEELGELKRFWGEKLERLQIHTPDPAFDSMVNIWNAYQCFITFVWSRAASFLYCGQRDGYGFRDTVQDIQGIIHLAPEMAREKLRLMLSGQADNGAGLPLVGFHHEPGHEKIPGDPGYEGDPYRADDALWLFPTVSKYLCETGDASFLDEVIPFANRGESSVYEHLKRALRFSAEHGGAHGMPAGLSADWNDCLRMGEKGESTFVAFQFFYAMRLMREWAQRRNDADYARSLDERSAALQEALQKYCWEGDRFLRGICEDGRKVGSKGDPEADLWLNPQSWAVISGCAEKGQGERALDLVHERLNTEYGALLLDPPYREHAFDGAKMLLFNPSAKENGGVFSQPQGWLILAEALLGRGDRAFEYFRECSPAEKNDRAELRRIEPYAHGQFVEGKYSPNAGRAHVHWLTGTASTVMVGCVEGILGLRPTMDGLEIRPSVPSSWKGFSMEKTFRGKRLRILVHNPQGVQGGEPEIVLNGKKLTGCLIPAERLERENRVEVTMR
jgi:cellobiose phosphorylase